uniref:Wound-induced protein 1 n=1 Tax=Leersia perrieri TaxID=77586 RepID=A0A0D9WFA4_9ORYZ
MEKSVGLAPNSSESKEATLAGDRETPQEVTVASKETGEQSLELIGSQVAEWYLLRIMDSKAHPRGHFLATPPPAGRETEGITNGRVHGGREAMTMEAGEAAGAVLFLLVAVVSITSQRLPSMRLSSAIPTRLFLVYDMVLSQTDQTELASDKADANFAGDGDATGGGSKAVVEELYRALERGDGEAVRRLLNPDVDWWFHGPRAQQHLVLMRLLTGVGGGLPFKVRSVEAFGETVLAEGTDAATGKLYWVHAWTVGPGGRVTGVREYCNTALVVTRLAGGGGGKGGEEETEQVWQSRLPDRARCRNLFPALVLAI